MSDPSAQDQGQAQNPDPAQLRKQLDDSHKREQEKDAQIRQLTANNALHEASLGHLNEFQRTALLGAVGDEVNAQNLTEMASKLGFQAPAASPPTAQPGVPQPPATPEFVPPNPVDAHVEGVSNSITGLTLQEQAHIMARRGGVQDDFGAKLTGGHKSKEELLSIIGNQGKNHGLVLESDLD